MPSPLDALRQMKLMPSHTSGPILQQGPGEAVEAARMQNLKAKIEPITPDVANSPTLYPHGEASLRGLMGAVQRSGLDPSDPANIVGGGGKATMIPFSKLSNALRSGMAEELMQTARSPILRALENPRSIGSSDIAYGISGLGLSREEYPFEYPFFKGETSRAWSRLAQEEMKRITQEALYRMGIKPGESVDLFRGGPVPKTSWGLTPTHVSPEYVERYGMERGGIHKFEVPREQINAMVGLLKRGDELTEGEMLVPAKKLVAANVTPTKLFRQDPWVLDPNFYDQSLFRTPSWFKKSVLK